LPATVARRITFRLQVAKEVLDPAEHFGRGAPGESQQQDAARIDAMRNQPGDAMYERGSLPRAGAGYDQQRRIAMRGGFPLLGIQLLQKIFNRNVLRHAVPSRPHEF